MLYRFLSKIVGLINFFGFYSMSNVPTKDVNLEFIIQHKLMMLLNQSDICVFYCEFKANWPTLYISQNIEHFDYQAEDFISGKLNYSQVLDENDARLFEQKVLLAVEQGRDKVEMIARIKSPDNTKFWVDIRLVLERTPQGEISHFLGTLLDITDKIEMREKQGMLSRVLEQTSDIVKVTDPKGYIVFVNQAFTDVTGYVADEVMGQTPAFLKQELGDRQKSKRLWQEITQGRTYHNVIKNRKKNGQLYFEEITITPVYDVNDRIEYYVSTGKDVTERIRLENQLQEMAMTDMLTGACNRRRIDDVILQEMERVNRYGAKFSLILMDIDYFKLVNDNLGHATGDQVLIQVTELMRSLLRKNDHLGRWGGEEFLIIAQEIGVEEGLLLAEKIRLTIEAWDFKIDQTVTASFGVANYHEGETEVDLFKRLDEALYKAKLKGRNRVEMALA